jgi:O-acetyl-ADP-ribose deacetylase (regulator of RNase III)
MALTREQGSPKMNAGGLMDQTKGNVLDVAEGIIAHGCNALGVMGAGIAKQVKQRYPEAFRVYKQAERESGLVLGDVSFAQVGHKLWIANIITQERIYGAKGECLADLDAIEAGFAKVAIKARELGLRVEMPLVGCGLAGGEWADVQPRILAGLGEAVDSRLWIFEPYPKPAARSGWGARR